MFEFESIFKASYPLDFEVLYKHYGTDHPVGVREIGSGKTDEDKNAELILTEYPGLTKCYESVTEFCGFSSIEAGSVLVLQE